MLPVCLHEFIDELFEAAGFVDPVQLGQKRAELLPELIHAPVLLREVRQERVQSLFALPQQGKEILRFLAVVMLPRVEK